jgi:hypothetical protein
MGLSTKQRARNRLCHVRRALQPELRAKGLSRLLEDRQDFPRLPAPGHHQARQEPLGAAQQEGTATRLHTRPRGRRSCTRVRDIRRFERRDSSSADVFDDLDQFVDAVAVMAGEFDELSASLDDGTAFGCPGDRDASAASELEQSFVAEHP